jgi:hypothetical protein
VRGSGVRPAGGGVRAGGPHPLPELHAHLKERGYKGGYGTIRDYVLPFRQIGAAPPAVPGPPKARDLARWFLTDPDNLDWRKRRYSPPARGRCPHLDALAGHVTEFAKVLAGLHGNRLGDWLTAVEADDHPDLHSFARGIRRDYDAVLNGLPPRQAGGSVPRPSGRARSAYYGLSGR